MNKTESMIIGAITATGFGVWLLQAVGIIILAILGAFGGWIFAEYIKPWLKPKLDKLFNKK